MSDIGGGGGEPNLGGNLFDPNAFGPPGSSRGRRGRPPTGTATASLKFDIPGLKSFRDELKAVDAALKMLDTTFNKIWKAPEKYAAQLKAVNDQLKEMKKYGPMQPGGPGGTGRAGSELAPADNGSLISPSGSRTPSASRGAFSNIGNVLGKVLGGGEAEGGLAAAGGEALGAAGGPVGIAAAVGQGIEKKITESLQAAVGAMFSRFDQNMDQGTQADVYRSRNALAVGRKSHELFTQAGARGYGFGKGAIPFLPASQIEAAQVIDTGQGIGAIYGAPGIAGQRGEAFAQSVGQQQNLTGMSAGEAAQRFQGRISNVAGIQQGMAMFGIAASPYKKGGGFKSDQEFYTDIMNILKAQPRPSGKQPQPFSKIEIEAMAFPGSWAESNLIAMGLSNDQIDGFWTWAIANAASVESGTGGLTGDMATDRKKIEKVTGQRLSTETQVSTARGVQREEAFTGEQYGTMLTRQELEQQVTRLLDGLDSWLQDLYNVTGLAPKGVQGWIQKGIGMLTNPLGAGLNMLGLGGGGDPGYMGDPEGGLSHLTPDLRQRVGKMMGDNPRLKINSAYRDNLRQERLQGKGPFAPSGKSAHGRGQAVDLGPASEHGWMAANSKKYGIDMAGHMGEPWHAQLAGTLGFMGDPAVDPSTSARMAEQSLSATYFGLWTQVQAQVAAKNATAATTPAVDAGPWTGGAVPAATSGTAGSVDVSALVGKKDKLSFQEVGKVAYAAGFRGEDLVDMMAIAMRESGLNPVSWVEDKDDVGGGLWAINQLPYLNKGQTPPWSKAEIQDPVRNAQIAYQMFTQRGFQPWNMPSSLNAHPELPKYLSGTKNHYAAMWLDDARAAAKSAGLIGDAGYGWFDDARSAASSAMGDMAYNGNWLNNARATASRAMGDVGSSSGGGVGLAVSSPTVTFNNTFHITMQGGANRSDVDVVTRQIAARLETHIQRVVSRRN